MTRSSSLSPDNILRFLQVTASGATTEEIGRALQASKSDRKTLFRMLSRLKKRDLIAEVAPGKYRLKSTREPSAQSKTTRSESFQALKRAAANSVSGRLVLHQDGYGFVIPDEPIANIEGDIFIPRHATEDAMHGDRVTVEISRRGFSPGGQRIEGRIVGVLDRAHASVVGLFRYGPHSNVVLPYDTRIHHQVEIPPGQELTLALRKKLGLASPEEAAHKSRRLPKLTELDG